MHDNRSLPILEVPVMQRSKFFRFRQLIGSAGLIGAAFMLVWLITSLLGLTVSIVDIFGIGGIRIPAGIAIGGLMLAAIGFNKF